MNGSKGIAFAGNIIVDVVKMIDRYPEHGMLSNISSVSLGVGGIVPNTAIDIAKLDPKVPICAIGKVGNDEYGSFVMGQLEKYGIDVSRVKVSDNQPTSFSDVMTVKATGGRTFFHARGANAEFDISDIDLDNLSCDIFHAGYILLLDKFDEADPEYGTVMARLLHNVQAKGIKTSIDVVSDSSQRFKEKVLPALRYCNYAIMNEIEACGVCGLSPRNGDGSVNVENIRKAMGVLLGNGVKDKVIVHCLEGGFCLSSDGSFSMIGSVDVPRSEIVGAVGAGDAFCAGCLYGIYNGYSDTQILDFASCAAVCSLSAADSVSGMKSKEEVEKLGRMYPRMKLV